MHSTNYPASTDPKPFLEWLQTHEAPCRQMVRCTCLRRADILHSVALEPDDVFGEVYMKLRRKNPMIPSVASLMKLVGICALNHLRDKGRKNKTRQSIFEAPLEIDENAHNAYESERREYDPSRSPAPDRLLLDAESVVLLHEAALSDPETAWVFRAIRDLEENGVTPSISNLSRYLGRPYAVVRRSRMRLQKNIRQALG